MTTYRDLAKSALSALKALAPGDDMIADEQVAALAAIQEVFQEIHAARGPMKDVDVIADYVAGENERVRVQTGHTVNVTLPNAIKIVDGTGSTGSADTQASQTVTDFGFSDGAGNYRQPRDGARIEIVGTTQGLYFYRSDLNVWGSVYTPAIDDVLPFNQVYQGHLAALVAQRLVDTWPSLFEPTASLMNRIKRANSAIYLRPSTFRDPAQAEYF